VAPLSRYRCCWKRKVGAYLELEIEDGTAVVDCGAATVRYKDMNIIDICKNDEDPKLRKAIYIGEGGQVTTLNGRSPLGGPERSLIPS
jgi:hypothetical protein